MKRLDSSEIKSVNGGLIILAIPPALKIAGAITAIVGTYSAGKVVGKAVAKIASSKG